MTTQATFSIEAIQDALEEAYDDDRWLAALTVAHHTGVADTVQLRSATGLSRGQLNRLLERFDELAPQSMLVEVPFNVAKPGKRGRPSTVYSLGRVGAALLRANGYEDAQECGLTTETQIGHARAVLDVRLAAEAAGCEVVTEHQFGYTDDGEERVLRPDNLVTLPDGTQALFEVEQRADLTLLRRIRDSVRNKVTFFQSEEAKAISPHVRVLIDLPHGTAWGETVGTWERATTIVAEEHGGYLPFHIAALPMLDFLDNPDWAEPPDGPRWESLFDPAQTSTFEPRSDRQRGSGRSDAALARRETHRKPRRADLPPGLRRRSIPDDHLIMEAYWMEVRYTGPELMYTYDRPEPHPSFFDMMRLIYTASYPPDASSWQRACHPSASLYLFLRYLQMHPRLRKALSKSIVRGRGSMRWSTPAITHRIQVVTDVFLRYHGFSSGGSLQVHVLSPWERGDGRGNFGVGVSIEPEVLMGQEDGVVPTQEEVEQAAEALSWVLTAIFAYSDDLQIKHARFW